MAPKAYKPLPPKAKDDSSDSASEEGEIRARVAGAKEKHRPTGEAVSEPKKHLLAVQESEEDVFHDAEGHSIAGDAMLTDADLAAGTATPASTTASIRDQFMAADLQANMAAEEMARKAREAGIEAPPSRDEVPPRD